MKNKPVAAVLALAVVVIAASLLGSCFSPWQGNDATVSLSLGTDPNSRITEAEKALFSYDIRRSRPNAADSLLECTVKPGDALNVQFSVPPGEWKIEVLAYMDAPSFLSAKGSNTVHAVAGKNTPVPIIMREVYTVTFKVFSDCEFTRQVTRNESITNFPFSVNDIRSHGEWPEGAVYYLHSGTITNNYDYILDGWYKTRDGDDFADKWDNEKNIINENITLHAKWSDNGAIDVSGMTGNNHLEKAVAYVNAVTAGGESYTLVIGGDGTVTSGITPVPIRTETVTLTIQSNNADKRKLTLSDSGSSNSVDNVYNFGSLIDVKLKPTINLYLEKHASVEILTLIASGANSRPGVTIDAQWAGKIGKATECGLNLAGSGAIATVKNCWKNGVIVKTTNSNTDFIGATGQIIPWNFVRENSSEEDSILNDYHFEYDSADQGWKLKLNSAGDVNIDLINDLNGTITFSGDGSAPTGTVAQGKKLTATYSRTGEMSGDIEWYIWDALIASGDNPITINTANYNKGTYQLTVIEKITVTTGVTGTDIPYSTETSFTVQ